MGSRFQGCSPATENALEPTDNDTREISYCPLSAERRRALLESVASGMSE